MSLRPEDRERLAELNEPAPIGARFGVTRYLYELYRARPDLMSHFPDLDRDGQAFVEWIHAHGRHDIPVIDELLPPRPREFRYFMPAAPGMDPGERPWWGVNLVGYLEAELGLGEAARLTVSALDAASVPVLPVAPSWRPATRQGHPFSTIPPTAAGFPINVVSMSVQGALSLRHEIGPELFADRVTVGQCWWEAGPLPVEWRQGLSMFDELWVASDYVRDVLEPQVSIPVRKIPLAVDVPLPSRLARGELGLPDGYLFLFIFDYASTLKRKNPDAVVKAFMHAFEPGEGASLAIKCINPGADGAGHARLTELAGQRADITVLPHYVAPEDKNAMIAACDCYVSLHRAEGFGLTLAEAMYLGKPVIATRFSGNLEFMTDENSYLVDHTITGIGEGARPYQPSGTWAEPSVEHAATLMRAAFEDREAARSVGLRGARDIRRTHSPSVVGTAMRARLTELADELRASHDAEAQTGSLDVGHVLALARRGPVPPPRSAAGPLGGLLRRALFRLLKPYTVHQQALDSELVELLDAAAQSSRVAYRALARARRSELVYAHDRAAQLRTARVRTAAPSRPSGPSNGANGTGTYESAVLVSTDLGELLYPRDCHSITPAVQRTGNWRLEQASAIREAVVPGMTVVDVGAHVGYFALLLARCVGAAGRVIAIEADPQNCALLQANVASIDWVTITQAAAWSESGSIELWRSPGDSGDHRSHPHSGAAAIPVAASALDELLAAERHIDYVLLDTRGSEAAVLDGMRATIATHRPPIQLTLWPEGIRASGGDPLTVLRSFGKLGYEFSVLGFAGSLDDDPARIIELAEQTPGGTRSLLLTPPAP